MSGTSGWNHKGSIGWCNYTGMDDVRRIGLSSWLMSPLPLGSFSLAVLSASPSFISASPLSTGVVFCTR